MEDTQLSSIYKSVNLDLPSKFIDIAEYSDSASLYKYSPSERIGSGLAFFYWACQAFVCTSKLGCHSRATTQG